MRYPTYCVLFAVIWLFGCRTTPDVPYPIKPTGQLLDLKVQEAKLDYVILQWDIEIFNPTSKPLSLVGLKYSLTSGGNTFLSATRLHQTVVPSNSKEAVTLEDKIVYNRLLRALNCEPGLTIPYRVRSWVLAKTPRKRSMELSLTRQGQLALPNPAEAQSGDNIIRTVDVVFIGTPHDVVDKMLEMANVQKDDQVYDLGCGDGRIVVAAAEKYGCRAVGYDIDPQRVREALDKVNQHGVGALVRIEQRDIFSLDLSEADVVTIYLDPRLNERLIPQLEKLKPGARVVSHSFGIGSIQPDEVVTFTSQEDKEVHRIYLWTVPLREPK